MKIGRLGHTVFQHCASTKASQVAELAIALPILMIVVVGITDFGSAFNAKQILNSAAREGARLGANATMADVTNSTPNSVTAIRDAVDNYLINANMNDCGLGAASPGPPSGLAWTYQLNAACPGGGTLTLVINRGAVFQTSGTPGITIEMTAVHLSYPFQWRFGKLMNLIVPSPGYGVGITQISADAVLSNGD
jgi:hypothetical protein